jgi:hypothetical protein
MKLQFSFEFCAYYIQILRTCKEFFLSILCISLNTFKFQDRYCSCLEIAAARRLIARLQSHTNLRGRPVS